jgi:hypothetical protein
MLGGVSLLVTSAVNAWGAYLPLLGITGFALGLGWTLPSIGNHRPDLGRGQLHFADAKRMVGRV